MENIFSNIDKQIESNQGKNLFANSKNATLRFIQETVLLCGNPNDIPAESEETLIEYTVGKVLDEFYRINQYFNFSKTDVDDLHQLYKNLFTAIRNQAQPINEIAEQHYSNLKDWLRKSNPFAEKINDPDKSVAEAVACSEYSSDLQLKILGLNINTCMQPLLDIGCGKSFSLVRHLRDCNLDACGFDRFPSDVPFIFQTDWLSFNYGDKTWGTIISHLGFANHFRHHHFRQDGNYIGYGQTYMKILSSLKPGGCFHYCPDLPFIEEFLDPSMYSVTRLNTDNDAFQTVIVRRLHE
ncbi:MAG: hypothetical protein AB7V36_07790 [Bacteroidales bacterium]